MAPHDFRRPYFAYGMNMSLAHMGEIVPGARFLGVGRLDGYRWKIAKHGYASVNPEAEWSVPGVVFELGESEEAILDEFEGVGSGLYRKCELPVVCEWNQSVLRCLVYVTDGEDIGAAQPGYMDIVFTAAVSHGLSPVHLRLLESFV